MALKGLDKLAYGVFGGITKKMAQQEKYLQLELQLEKAQMTTRAEAHIAKAMFLAMMLAIVGAVAVLDSSFSLRVASQSFRSILAQ